MQRLFNRDFHKSYFSLSQTDLQNLHSSISQYHIDDTLIMSDAPIDLRRMLTSVPSYQFKVNNAKLPVLPILTDVLSLIAKRIKGNVVPQKSPSSSHQVPIKFPKSSPKVSQPSAAPSTADGISTPQPLNASTLQSILPYLPPLLRSEATSVQELYYIPRAQLHDRLYSNVATALTRYNQSSRTDQDQRTILGADSTRQSLATEIDKYDQRIQNFWNRIHWYQDSLNGNNPYPDILARLEKAAHRIGCSVPSKDNVEVKALGSYTKQEIDGGVAMVASGATFEELKSARILRNKKLLNRRDRQKTDTHRLTIEQAITELHDWGIPIERGQQTTATYYGYEVPADWLKQTPTKEEKAAAHNEAVKRSYAKKTAIKREMKAALEAEAKAQFQPLP